MTVSIIASAASGAIERSLGSGSTRYANSVSALIAGGTEKKSNLSIDTSRIGDAIARQAQAAGLRAASLNIAQASSRLSVAESGVGEIGHLLGRLQELASRASDDGVTDGERSGLSDEFQSVLKEIDRVVRETRFQGKNLLDGSLTASDLGLTVTNDSGAEVGIPNLSTGALFNGKGLDISTEANAEAALKNIKAAKTEVSGVGRDIASFSLALEIGAAALESALHNQDAANSVLTEVDLVSMLLGGGDNENNTTSSLFGAQTGRLSNDILQLLSE